MARVDRVTLARRVKARRLELGLTQREVAGDDFTRGFISQIENGLIDPSLKSLEVIAKRLGSPIGYFLADPDTVDPVTIEQSVRQTYESLNHNLETAASASAVALEGARAFGNPALLARASSGAAWVAYRNREFARASELFLAAAEAHRIAGNAAKMIRALNAAGTAAHRAGDLATAKQHYMEALQKIPSLEEKEISDHLRVLLNLSLLLTAENKATEAIERLKEAMALSVANKEYCLFGDIQNALGINYRRSGAIEQAIHHYLRSLKFYEAVDEPIEAAHAMVNSGIAYADSGDFEKAREFLSRSLDIYTAKEQQQHAANAQAELASVAWRQKQFDEAYELTEAALQFLTDVKERGRMLILKGRLLAKKGDAETAIALFRKGLDLLGDTKDTDVAEVCFELGELLMGLGKAEEASPYLARAANLYRDLRN